MRYILCSLMVFFSLIGLEINALANPDPRMCNGLLGGKLTEEQELKNDGLSKTYTAGLDRTNDILRLRHFFNNTSIDPKDTHISYFDSLLDRLLDFVDYGIKMQSSSSDMNQRLSILNDFRTEALERRNSDQINYRWWVNFNFRLSILATPADKRSVIREGKADNFLTDLYASDDWLTNERLEQAYLKHPNGGLNPYLNDFPNVVILPSVDGDMGIMAINKLFMSGLKPFGLIPIEVTSGNEKIYPDHFFYQNLIALKNEADAIAGWSVDAEEVERFHEGYLRLSKQMTSNNRELFELVYFIATHERPYLADKLIAGDASAITDILFKQELGVTVQALSSPSLYKKYLPERYEIKTENDILEFINMLGSTFRFNARDVNEKFKPRAKTEKKIATSNRPDPKLAAQNELIKALQAAGRPPEKNFDIVARSEGYSEVAFIGGQGLGKLPGHESNVGYNIKVIYTPTGGSPVQLEGFITREYSVGIEMKDVNNRTHGLNINFGNFNKVYVMP